MIAASILLARALAPVEQAIAQWSVMQRAFQGWKGLVKLLQATPPPSPKTALPSSLGAIEAEGVSAAAPGMRAPTLRNVNFRIEPGTALGVIGPSGAGKSTLARLLAGIWRPVSGTLRIDGATLDQFTDDERGRRIGYLPQDLALFDASVAENISRLADDRDDDAVVEAARRAGAHEMILSLPGGYDTQIGPSGTRLSGGQRQRIALARALYGDPAIVVLDEPNAHLDAAGEQALTAAITELRQRGRTVVVMAHRPSAISACNMLLMLDDGNQRSFGDKDKVLRETTLNYPQVVRTAEATQP
jgi:ATP-binding cassette subfamily C protein